MKAFILFLLSFFKPQPMPTQPIVPTPEPLKAPPVPSPSERVYEAAKSCLGEHITLDNNVPHELGCAEAVSYVLNLAGIKNIPPKGFAGTYDLLLWLEKNFEEVFTADPGNVAIAATGTQPSDSPLTNGHVAICGKFGLMSNSSATGLFEENYTLASFTQRYKIIGKFKIRFFKAT